jgi:hypothetical protein
MVQDCRVTEGEHPDRVPLEHVRNPMPLDLILTADNIDNYKKPDCASYVLCLDVAADHSWQQFHCNDCRAYVPELPDRERHVLFTNLGLLLVKAQT